MQINTEKNKRKSIRLKEYDYSKGGYYFVTILAYKREHLFGEITKGKMELNGAGKVVEACINEISKHFPIAQIDYFCIMPNHFHLILILNEDCKGTACRALTESFGRPVRGSVPTIIRSLKSASTKQINIMRKSLGSPVFHRNYYEHIVRNEKELYEIRKYIKNNPLQWELDEYYKQP